MSRSERLGGDAAVHCGGDARGRQGRGGPRTEISSRWLDRCMWSTYSEIW